jgi:hypothetical protein
MTRQAWRIDPMSGGALAWLYVRAHEVDWSVPAAAHTAQGYAVTEERQVQPTTKPAITVSARITCLGMRKDREQTTPSNGTTGA